MLAIDVVFNKLAELLGSHKYNNWEWENVQLYIDTIYSFIYMVQILHGWIEQ